jgi:undecaprenyl-diphosphatase
VTAAPPGLPRSRRPALVAAAVAAVLLAAFIAIAWMAKAGTVFPAWDGRITEAVVTWRSPSWSRAFWVFTLSGDTRILVALSALVVLPLVAWGRRARATIVAGGLLVTWGLVYLTKAMVARDRPPSDLALVRPPASHSMPSGHAAVTIVFWGLLASLIFSWIDSRWLTPQTGGRRARGRVLLKSGVVVVAAALVGASRVYLGVHWTSDVLAGWCLGGALMVVMGAGSVAWERACGLRRGICDSAPFRRVLRLGLVAGLLLVLVAAAALTALADPLR